MEALRAPNDGVGSALPSVMPEIFYRESLLTSLAKRSSLKPAGTMIHRKHQGWVEGLLDYVVWIPPCLSDLSYGTLPTDPS
jgi:hypothetical protein